MSERLADLRLFERSGPDARGLRGFMTVDCMNRSKPDMRIRCEAVSVADTAMNLGNSANGMMLWSSMA